MLGTGSRSMAIEIKLRAGGKEVESTHFGVVSKIIFFSTAS